MIEVGSEPSMGGSLPDTIHQSPTVMSCKLSQSGGGVVLKRKDYSVCSYSCQTYKTDQRISSILLDFYTY